MTTARSGGRHFGGHGHFDRHIACLGHRQAQPRGDEDREQNRQHLSNRPKRHGAENYDGKPVQNKALCRYSLNSIVQRTALIVPARPRDVGSTEDNKFHWENKSPRYPGFDDLALSRGANGSKPHDPGPPVNWVLPLERAACGLRGPTRTARTTIYCRKLENYVSLPHEQSCASACPDCGLLFRRLSTLKKSAEKKFPRFMSRNPLKSHDSDEIIQGNPTLIIGAFAAKRPQAKKIQTEARRRCSHRQEVRVGTTWEPSSNRSCTGRDCTKTPIKSSFRVEHGETGDCRVMTATPTSCRFRHGAGPERPAPILGGVSARQKPAVIDFMPFLTHF
jgi:hypothetical protein